MSKSLDERIERIYRIVKEHFGAVYFARYNKV